MNLKAQALRSDKKLGVEPRGVDQLIGQQLLLERLTRVVARHTKLELSLAGIEKENFLAFAAGKSVDPLVSSQISVIQRKFKGWPIECRGHKEIGRIMIQMALLERTAADSAGLQVEKHSAKIFRQVRHLFRQHPIGT